MSFRIRSVDYHGEAGDMVSEPPGVPIHASYGHYPNKRNFMRLGSEASVTYNIL